jgi:hypothetical protein
MFVPLNFRMMRDGAGPASAEERVRGVNSEVLDETYLLQLGACSMARPIRLLLHTSSSTIIRIK